MRLVIYLFNERNKSKVICLATPIVHCTYTYTNAKLILMIDPSLYIHIKSATSTKGRICGRNYKLLTSEPRGPMSIFETFQ